MCAESYLGIDCMDSKKITKTTTVKLRDIVRQSRGSQYKVIQFGGTRCTAAWQLLHLKGSGGGTASMEQIVGSVG
jgi:hypothetical protein